MLNIYVSRLIINGKDVLTKNSVNSSYNNISPVNYSVILNYLWAVKIGLV